LPDRFALDPYSTPVQGRVRHRRPIPPASRIGRAKPTSTIAEIAPRANSSRCVRSIGLEVRCSTAIRS